MDKEIKLTAEELMQLSKAYAEMMSTGPARPKYGWLNGVFYTDHDAPDPEDVTETDTP